jgi:hypothetical protein
VLVPLVLAGLAWVVLFGAARMRPGEIAQRTPSQEFLGPGGPDDPDRR